jgi:hypothetical protein
VYTWTPVSRLLVPKILPCEQPLKAHLSRELYKALHELEALQVRCSGGAPATANKMLSALRGVIKECWRLGYIGTEERDPS